MTNFAKIVTTSTELPVSDVLAMTSPAMWLKLNAIDTAPSLGALHTIEVGMELYNFAEALVKRGV